MSVPNGHPVHGDDAIAFRPLILQTPATRVSIPVSALNNDWLVACVVREEFLLQLPKEAPTEAPTDDEDDAAPVTTQAQVELVSQFLRFVATRPATGDKAFATAQTALLLAALKFFTATFLHTADVHSLTAEYDPETRKAVLSAYFLALSQLEDALPVSEVPYGPPSALINAAKKGEAELYGIFGGQGTNDVYFDELQALYDIYTPYVHAFLERATTEVLQPLAAQSTEAGYTFYTHGLDALGWLSGTTPRPPVDYLGGVPVSLPLIGLAQLTQYLVACRVLRLHPGELRTLIAGTTGHSQGIVPAVAVSASDSFASLETNVHKALRWLFFCGLRGQHAFPVVSLEPALIADCLSSGEGLPSPMLGITGLALEKLRPHVDKTNKHLPENAQLFVSLHNGARSFVVTGPARALCGLVVSLRKIRAPAGLDQSKVPFSQRKPVFSVRFLGVPVPFHSKYLEGCTERMCEEDLGGEEFWTPEQLGTAVYHTETGTDLRTLKTSLTRSLADQIFTQPIHWTVATDFPRSASHAIDFGPGGLSGIGSLTQRNIEGRGVRVLIMGQKGRGGAELYDAEKVRREEDWEEAWKPKLVKTLDGRIQIDTPFSRLLGKPPIMVAGMTPTTVKAGFVSAVLRAGYHVELAGGGHYNAAALRAKVAEIQATIPPGVGLTLNALYINQRQFGFQFPLWQEMRREGVPVDGFCVAAGIPSTEKAAEIIGALKAAGIRHVAFKPGSVDGIRQVVNIAAANPDFPIILQWTGGRAGGHHSCEDFHQPILQTYPQIRKQKNIALVAGSGFGGAEDAWPYITGEWSRDRLGGVSPMPFDGVLFASWVMTALEAHTSESVKQLIVAAPGVDDAKWEGTYAKETGGILTVKSELGEPIHKIATRAVKLWKEYDDTVFALPKEKRIIWLAQNKDKVIARLNKDFQKPWFPRKKDGSVAADIGDMTYEEVVRRMVELMYVTYQQQNRWIDISLRNLVGDWLRRVEERFAGANGHGLKPSVLQSFKSLDEPEKFLDEVFFKAYPEAQEQLVASEDAKYFLAISQRPGQKPVPFIPVLDVSFEVWFKKDSLWQAEDIDAVVDQDPQRVCILQGPVAAKHAKVANVPIKDMLSGVEAGLVSRLLERYYGGDESRVPTVDYIGATPLEVKANVPAQYGIAVAKEGEKVTYTLGKSLPPVSEWLDFLAGPKVTWFSAFLRSLNVAQGKSYVDNPIRRLFAPRSGQKLELAYSGEEVTAVAVYGATRLVGPQPSNFKAVEVTYDASAKLISVTLNENRLGTAVPLSLLFTYRPDMGFCPIHEVMEKRNWRIKEFYWRLWFGDEEALPSIGLMDTLTGPEVSIDADTVERFCAVVGNEAELFKAVRNDVVQAPMDFAIVTGWEALMKSIFPPSIDGDLLKLVHMSNGFRQLDGKAPLKVGDVCSAAANIASVVNTESGKLVTVKGHLFREGEPVVEVTSSFLYRGRFTDFENTFEKTQGPDFEVALKTAADVGVLQSKEWFQWDNDALPLLPGTTLVFKVETELSYKDKASYSAVRVEGAAYQRDQVKGLVKVATIEYESGPAHGNPVTAYLERHGAQMGTEVMFESGGYTLTSSDVPSVFVSPAMNEPYSKISSDFNPIHVNPYFADYAVLPGTITHGMWSSAATRKYVESVAAQGCPDRVLSYNVNFVGMVLPGDELNVKLTHVGMKEGNMLVKVQTTTSNGDKIIEGMAEVAQPPSAFVFTGQGSQEQNMGMELYANSPAARAVWDAADAHLGDVYGFSIIDIVRNNPRTKVIHFGGIKGQAIRARYINMTYDTMDKDGHVKTLPLFPEITDRSLEFMFSSPSGLLYATQFAQIALVVTEKAAFEDMKANGLIQKNCAFAGHSLGEYSALASIAGVLPISALTDVVFFRGLTMQRAVERDTQNRSNYAMCAVNPSRISKTFTDAALREVVDVIGNRTDTLLEIVNFNVEGQQYVCAGELVSLQTLTNVLNYLKKENIDIPKLTEKFSVEKVKEMLDSIVDECFSKAKELQAAEGHIVLERGYATIPLPGIDVPFHSRYLWAGVLPFRAYLSKKINPTHLDPDLLIGKYIPNLIAEPFQVSKSYAQKIYDHTSSPKLDKVLRHWEEENWELPENRQKLAYTILVELLAYQFASPVRWIETQDLLFSRYKVERFIEVGPSPTLTGMATRTLKAKYEAQDDALSRRRLILCASKNTKEIYYQFEDEAAGEAPAEGAAESAPPAPAAAAPTVAASVVAAPPAGAAVDIPDEPLKAIDTLRIIIAQKLKKKTEEIPLGKTIKDLVGGKSTMQNEILGDLQLEFTSAPEKGEEMPLEELGGALGTGYSGTPGKYTAGLISRMVGGKMPGGFNASTIKTYLSKMWGLGNARADAVLLLATTMEPAKRLGSEAEAKAWLDSVVASYAKQAGISLSSGSTGGAAGGSSGGAVINSEEFLKFQAQQERFVEQTIQLNMRYLGKDSRAGQRAYEEEKASAAALQAKLDAIDKEHGDTYIQGIQPVFEPLKARHFDSSWNWVRQDVLLMFYDIIFGRLTTVDREITARCIAIMNRADPALIRYMQYRIDMVDPTRGETYKLAKEFGQRLIDNCKEVVNEPPKYKDVTFPTAPQTEITAKGDMVYSEVNRASVRKLEAYVQEMASGGTGTRNVNYQKVHDDVTKLWNFVKSQPDIGQEQKQMIKNLHDEVVRSLRRNPGETRLRPSPRQRRSSSQFLRPKITSPISTIAEDKLPLLHLKRKVGNSWQYSSNLTSVYMDVLTEIATSGTTFRDKNALLTGVGKGSIGVEILKGLLSGGASVVVTTSRYSRATVEYYQHIFQKVGSRGAALTVVPFNQGSRQDVEALVDYIYTTLGMDLDYVIPFAALPENGREIDGIDDKSELAHRVMLVNVLRLLGAVKTKKAARHFVTRPTQVVLPLSPNHGLFGNDGLYSESKISLETLFNRWSSESWGEYLCLAGAVIGWTRGTGLMNANNYVAQKIEEYGVRTFSAKEMAFNILGLMHPILFGITQVEPIWADLNGGMDRLPDIADITTRIRLDLNQTSEVRKAVNRDTSADFKVVHGVEAERLHQTVPVTPRANFKFDFPRLESIEALSPLSQLRGMIDLDKVIVVTGFAEVGPWGSSRTRWEMEARGEFSIEGCIEMAWMMGYIKHFDGRLKNGQLYVGWVDSKTDEPVDDKDIKGKYEKDILAHAGIRLIEPELFKGYNPEKKIAYQEIEINYDLEPLEVAEADASKFKLEHGDRCDIWEESGTWFVKIKKGARVIIPKAFRFDRLVAGQIPTGWNAGRYGIPDDIISQTDRTALWALACTAEALTMSGFSDPYELYKYVHPAEVGSSIGSGMGGMQSLAAMFKDRREEKDVQKDVLQETFINTVAGWVNLLLLSSSGPIKVPVGACATALQSLEIACDTILSGKAKVMVAGGFDDFSEEGSFEFANMKATSNAETEFAMGREPTEFSRPTTSTRSGFMESQGTGIQILMSAKTALEMGASIHGIVGFTSTATDKQGRSIPAPGRGVLTAAREITPKNPLPLLDIKYRSRQLAFRRRQISQWLENEQAVLNEEVELRRAQGETVDDSFVRERVAFIEEEAERQEKEALNTFGMLEGSDPRVAPLRRALAVWGLTADDIGCVSIHGTSTKANDKNESSVYNDIFHSISRTPGNCVPVIAQKNLTGHPKGGAAAWMLQGLLQSVNSGIIPGNRNADNVDSLLRQYEYLIYPSKSVYTDGIACGLMTSFGFGQVGGMALMIHPRYLFASLSPSVYEEYATKNRVRALSSYRAMSDMMITNSLVKIKDHPPYSEELEKSVLLNPLARTQRDALGGYTFTAKQLPKKAPIDDANASVLVSALSQVSNVSGVGVDHELISAVPSSNPNFLSRNFTDTEISYCRSQPNPEASFAARWAGKEAVFKSLGVSSRGAAAPMKEIEIVSEVSGVPSVVLHGEAKSVAESKGISKILLSLSHSETVAVAFAQATSN